jgi:hypothetical protein
MGFLSISCRGSNQIVENPPIETHTPSPDLGSQDDFFLEQTPTFEVYAVSGIALNENLNLYQDPAKTSEVIGYIPSYGTGLKPLSNVLVIDEDNFIQVKHNDLIGWVDYANLADQHGDLPENFAKLGQMILTSIKNEDYKGLKRLIHPELCLRFSPYSYLNSDNQIFCGQDIESMANSDKSRLWGYYDGTGDGINLNFADYHQRFIYDQDYLHAKVIGFNQEVSSGNSINNIPEFYPDGMMIEYHFTGFDPQYGGLDWRSIRLVFIEHDSEWFLVAIIHSEWTI